MTAWMVREDAPPFYDVRKPLATFLVPAGTDVAAFESWLFEGLGDPPRADLWRDWVAKQRHRRTTGASSAKQRKRR